jgi:hypothetical protein
MRIFSILISNLFFLLSCALINEVAGQIQTVGAGGNPVVATGLSVPGNGTLTGNLSGQQTFMALSARGGWKLPAFENINGSPFLHPEYNLAQVRVKSGFSTNAVMVKFNIYGNEIIFRQNGNEMALDSVDYISYVTIGKNGAAENIRLKTGYPSIGTYTQNTIYQILDSGSKVQLLKYYYQTVGEVKTMGSAPTKEFITFQDLYVYSSSGEMKKIKPDLKSLQEAMPAYSEQIEKIVTEKKLKLKKEADLIQLFTELNSQPKAF